MRIISPFHDYYDTAQGLGYDPTRIYRREVESKVIPAGELDPAMIDLLSRGPGHYNFEGTLAIVGFCGNLYPVYFAPSFSIGIETLTSKLPRSPIMSRRELDDYYGEVFSEWHTKWWRSDRDRFFEVLECQGVPASDETFLRLGAPVWLAHRAEWSWRHTKTVRVYTNIRLANFDFQKYFDAYTAFQEIAMYLGSVLAETDESVRTVGSDEVLAGQKGFGPESFRSAAPSVKKTRRKENRARKRGSSS